MTKHIYIITLLFCLMVVFKTTAQISVKSGDVNVVTKIDTLKKDSIIFNFKSDLITKSSGTGSKNIHFKLFVKRNETTNTINVSVDDGEIPEFIVIERKSSAPLSEYRTIKTFSSEDLEALAKDRKLNFDDNYPESRQLDCYYRVVYGYGNEIKKFLPGVLLLGQNTQNQGELSHQNVSTDIFIEEKDTLTHTNEEFGLAFNVQRNVTVVNLNLFNDMKTKNYSKIVVQRKGSGYLDTFRKVYQLDNDELKELLDKGQLAVQDKYPPSQKFDSFYRLVITVDEIEYELPEVKLERMKAN